MGAEMTASTVQVGGANGDQIEAYLARPVEPERRGAVVVIHHLPGYDRGSKEIVRRFAELGYDAIMPNLYWRQAAGLAPAAASTVIREQGGISDAQLVGDVAGAAAHLRSLDSSNGRVGVIGYCSGGRQSVLAACTVEVDAAVDCYGAYVTGTPSAGFPLLVTNLVDRLADLRCPVLGLFGNDDQAPSPPQVDEFEQILTSLGKPFEFHRYDGAGHAFFSTDRAAYRFEAANDGWERITDFFQRHLSG